MFNRLKRRFDAAVSWRVDEQVSRSLDAQLARRDLDAGQLAARRADYEARLGGLQADYSFIRSEFDRLAPQLAALEYRFERLRSRLDLPESDIEGARALAEIEHERARVRLEVATSYEERLRRLEEHGRA
jgi:phage shock protein A